MRIGIEKDIDIRFGKKVRLRRNALGMSQKELAGRIGITFQQLQKYERGTNRVGISKLYLIAAALEVHPSRLLPEFGVDDTDPIVDRDTMRMLKKASVLDSKQKKMITSLMGAMAENGVEKSL